MPKLRRVDVASFKKQSGDPQITHIRYPRRSCRRSLMQHMFFVSRDGCLWLPTAALRIGGKTRRKPCAAESCAVLWVIGLHLSQLFSSLWGSFSFLYDFLQLARSRRASFRLDVASVPWKAAAFARGSTGARSQVPRHRRVVEPTAVMRLKRRRRGGGATSPKHAARAPWFRLRSTACDARPRVAPLPACHTPRPPIAPLPPAVQDGVQNSERCIQMLGIGHEHRPPAGTRHHQR